ncbi:MAG: protein kinase [Candidatus Hydrogenedens sp.]|nr:protein kinase [Candidatus Hydrogenedens sp.]
MGRTTAGGSGSLEDDRDNGLIFAVLAMQIHGLRADQVMEHAAAWMSDSSVPLPQRMLDAGLLTEQDIQSLLLLVQQLSGTAVPRPELDVPGRAPLDKYPSAQDSEELSLIEEHSGRYSYISEHGRGGMGRVLLVNDQSLGREIALKELLLPHSPGLGPGDESPMRETTARLARFIQEARVTGQLEHPGIIPVYELGRRDDGTLYYTMKLVRGQTLDAALRGAASLEKRLRYLPSVIDVCQALAYAHERGVIHRDIKPSNIMIGEFGETVLLDWGLAKVRGQEDFYAEKLELTLTTLRLKPGTSAPNTVTGEAVGTPHYMSPEQARGHVGLIDERSDVYSVGAVIYELLTGKSPYAGTPPDEALERAMQGAPPRVGALVREAPEELVSICEKAMALEPAKRYASMRALRDDLMRFQTGAFVQSYQYNLAQVLSRYYRRNLLLANTVLAALIALFALAGYSYHNILQARDREAEQRVAAEDARNAALQARDEAEAARRLTQRQAYLAQIRLAASQIRDQRMQLANEALDAAPSSERDWVWSFLKRQANPGLFRIRSTTSDLIGALYDPTGTYLAIFRYPEGTGLWNAATGDWVRDFEGGGMRYAIADFNEDGSRLAAIASEEGTIDVWDIATGTLTRLLHEGGGTGLAFSPITGHVYAGYHDGQVVEWNAETGEKVRVIATLPHAVDVVQMLDGGRLVLTHQRNGTATVWNADTGTEQYRVPAEGTWTCPSGAVFAAAKDDSLSLYQASDGSLLRTYPVGARLLSVSFSADEQQVLTGALDFTVKRWTRDSDTPVRTYRSVCDGHYVQSAFLDEGKRVLGCSGSN